MSQYKFNHLHLHTHYSLLDGASKIPALCKRVKALGMDSVAITDHGNLHGAIELLRESKTAGIKPIVGIEAYVSPGHRSDKKLGGVSGKEHSFHLTLLAQTGDGLRNLMRLSTKSFLEGFYHKPRIDREILERHSEGIICLSGCVSSEFSDYLLGGKISEAEALAVWYAKVFPGRFFVEIQDNGVSIQKRQAEIAVDVANRMGLPLVATSDAHYLLEDDARSHDLLLCINTNKKVHDPHRMKFDTDEFFVRSPRQMYEAMPGREEALARTVEIANSVEENYDSFGLGKRQFPSFAVPDGRSAGDYLRSLCVAGILDRYGEEPPIGFAARLDLELDIIDRMGFSSYILIVWDIVRFANENGIPCSARGSACGAVVAYLTRISHVDPLAFDLLFERFLDPSRSEAPDIDLDICKERRWEIFDYVKKKYGEGNVAQIGTFGTMATRMALKDVGRAMGVPLGDVEQLISLIPEKSPNLITAIAADKKLTAISEVEDQIGMLLKHAVKLEGTVRSIGTHAAGVVIADRPLIDMVPLRVAGKGTDNEAIVTQWEMGDIEKAGLLKMDFLGLRNLTSLQHASKLVSDRTGHPFDPYKLPLDDPATFSLLQRGEAKGVFQLDGDGIIGLLVRMKPDRFADIIAILALYRPGPMKGGMVDAYVERKHGREPVQYDHPILEGIFGETYGVMVYQEQVMRMLNQLGGIELSAAYAIIKAISKKKADGIAKGREQFLSGATAAGMGGEMASRIFDQVEFFGGYGFNKSHSTAYAHLSYMTAYMKVHYPVEFMAALLASEMDGSDRDKYLIQHIADAKKLGMDVIPPDINAGNPDFGVTEDGKITFGLIAIKGVVPRAAKAIAMARIQGGDFLGVSDLCSRVGDEVSQVQVEAMIKAGAFDRLGGKRSQLLEILPAAYRGAKSGRKSKKSGQAIFFQDDVSEPIPDHFPDIPELPFVELLAGEKATLGYYATAHPLDRHRAVLRAMATHQSARVEDYPHDTQIMLGGLASGLKVKEIKNPRRDGLTDMGKWTIEDASGTIAAMAWPGEYAKIRDLLEDDNGFIGFFKGKVSKFGGKTEVIVQSLTAVDRAMHFAIGLLVEIHGGVISQVEIESMDQAIAAHPGPFGLFFDVIDPRGAKRATYRAGNRTLALSTPLLARMISIFGRDHVRIVGPRGLVLPTEMGIEVELAIRTQSWPDINEEAAA